MTSYENFPVEFGFRIKKYPPAPNLSKIKPISCQKCKFLHFFIPRHIHNKRLPWQQTPEVNQNCHHVQNDPHRCKIKLEKFHFDILLFYGVIEDTPPPPPPGAIGLNFGILLRKIDCKLSKQQAFLKATSTTLVAFFIYFPCKDKYN